MSLIAKLLIRIPRNDINVTEKGTDKEREKVKEMERFQVLGYRNFNKKADNKPLTVITVVTDSTPVDNSRGVFGMKSVEFFLPDDRVGTLTSDCLGQEFLPEFGFNGYGKPKLVGFSFKAWKA